MIFLVTSPLRKVWRKIKKIKKLGTEKIGLAKICRTTYWFWRLKKYLKVKIVWNFVETVLCGPDSYIEGLIGTFQA